MAALSDPSRKTGNVGARTASFDSSVLAVRVPVVRTSCGKGLGDSGAVAKAFARKVPVPLGLRGKRTDHPGHPRRPRPPFPCGDRRIAIEGRRSKVGLTKALALPRGKGGFPTMILMAKDNTRGQSRRVVKRGPFLIVTSCLAEGKVTMLHYSSHNATTSRNGRTATAGRSFTASARTTVGCLHSEGRVGAGGVNVVKRDTNKVVTFVMTTGSPTVTFVISLTKTNMENSDLVLGRMRVVSGSRKVPSTF